MKYIFTWIGCCLIHGSILAQPSVQPLIKAEKDFERMSHQEGLTKAFVFFADANGLAFPDSGAANARAYWTARQSNGFFSWSPSYAEISDGGDWGYTTGSAQFRVKSLEDTVLFASQYTSVWHKDKGGKWKYLMDIGVGHASVPPDTVCKKVSVKKRSSPASKAAVDVMKADKNFNDAIVSDAKPAYQKLAGRHYLLSNEGDFIRSSVDSAVELLKANTIACIPKGAVVSPKGDMAFVYGRMRRNSKEINYIRIWRNETGGWKVALEVYQ